MLAMFKHTKYVLGNFDDKKLTNLVNQHNVLIFVLSSLHFSA